MILLQLIILFFLSVIFGAVSGVVFIQTIQIYQKRRTSKKKDSVKELCKELGIPLESEIEND